MSAIPNPFVYPKDHYKRRIDMLNHYVGDQAAHLAIMTGKTVDECRQFVLKKIGPAGEFAFKDPEVAFLERDIDTGDRSQQVGKFSQYLQEIIVREDIVAPTFTTYLHPKIRKSMLVGFQQRNVESRKVAKKAMFKAEMQEGTSSFTYSFKKSEQTGRKLSNNAVSGAHCNAHNPLYNKTAHSTLTSNCRQTAGYGNTNNERFLAGNRHYWSANITRNNIVSIVNHTDYDRLKMTMTKNNLHYPSVEETMAMIVYSTQLYWTDPVATNKLEHLVSKLSPLQRAAFVYAGDMYHLMKFNDAFVRRFMERLIEYIPIADPTPSDTLHSVPEAFVALAAQVCSRFMKGKTLMDIQKESPENYAILATVAKNIALVCLDYEDIIKTFWATDNLPASVAVLPDSLRRVVMASDTDSTIFTVQDWVKWYCYGMKYDDTADNIASAMIFLTSQTIIHVLATMSANAGVERDRIFQISMKNEFKFDIFALTNLGKHYFAQISSQEGNIFAKYKTEIKGVHLKSSNVPKEVVKQAEAMMISIMNQVRRGEKVSMLEKLQEVANLERSISTSIKSGEFKYLKLANIKVAASYKQGEESSNYLQYSLWNDVFGPKYGMAPAPPYRVIVVATELDSKAKMNAWMLNLEDKSLAARMQQWLTEKGRDNVPSLMLPAEIVAAKGIPEEIMKAVDVRKIIHKASAMFYLILETIGYYTNHTDLQHLAMDYY